VAIGTHLNIDDQTTVRVFVGVASVEFHCANTEVEMYEAELARFIETAQDVLPHLRSTAMELDQISAGVVAVAVDAAVDGPQVSGTWVICEATEPLRYMVLRDAVELRWGQLTWTLTGGALARLLDRARRAHTVLGQRLDGAVTASEPDLEIPDNQAINAGG
jgi:hypothetical protein